MLYFFNGFICGILIAVAIIMGMYFCYKNRQSRQKKIRGYLDLIPDLTPLQKEKVEKIRFSFLPKVQGIRESLYIQRSRLANALFQEPMDLDYIDSVFKELIHFQSKLEDEVIKHILEEKKILTSAQKKKFHNIIIEQFSSGGLGVHDVKK